MRYLVYVLVAANLVFLGWHLLLSPSAEPVAIAAAPVPPGIDALVLLSERGEKGASADAGTLPQTRQPEPPVDVAQPPPSAVTQPAEDPTSAPPPPQRVCRTVGPFLEKKDATQVFAVLAKKDYLVSVRDGDVREPAGYWVYLPAMPAQDARRIVADLDTHGMKDYFIGKQNHISLGIFSDKEKAQTRQQTVKRLGYDAVLDQRYRLRDVYWLDVEEKGQPLLGSETWLKLQAQHTDIRAQRVSCE